MVNKKIFLFMFLSVLLMGFTSAALTVTLNTPVDNFIPSTLDVEFNCSAVDDGANDVTNMSFFTNVTGSWVLNETVNGYLIGKDTVSDSHGESLSSSGSYSNFGGMKIQIKNNDRRIISVTKHASVTATRAQVWHNNQSVIATASFSGNVATFSSEPILESGSSYYIVVDNSGSSYTARWRPSGVSFPISDGYLDWTTSWSAQINSTDNSQAWNIETITLSDRSTSVDYNFTKTIEDIALWNCQACITSQCYFAGSNKTVLADNSGPSISVTYPTGVYDVTGETITLDLNWTVSDPNLDMCWFDYNGTNTTVTCGDNHTTFQSAGDTSLTFYANDSLGNLGIDSTIWTSKVVINSVTHDSLAYETSSQTYSVNVTANSSLTAVALVYNGTEYSTTQSGNVYSKTMDLSSTGNKSIRWKFTYAGDTYYSGYSYQQVDPILLGVCNATLTVPYVNFTFKDEETLNALNATIDTSTWTYYIGSGTATKSLLFSNATENDYYAFCLSPGNYTLYNTRNIQYSSTGYPQRKYDASSSLTNATTNTTLYLLSSSDGIYSTIQVVNQDGDKMDGVEVTVERQFSGVWTIIGQETTDDAGLVTFWLNPDYDHRFTFSGGGCTGTTVTIRPTQTQYTQQLQCGVSDEIYVSQIEGIKYARTPRGGIIQPGTYNFSYQVASSKSNLINISMEIVNASDGTVLNSTYSSCTPSGCTIYVMHEIEGGHDLKGKYYIDIGNGSILLEGDARWRVISIDTSGKAGIKTFFQDMKYLINEWGDDGDTADFNRLVIIFFFMALGISALNHQFGNDTQNPGAFLVVMAVIILMGSLVGGTSGQGFFYFNNLTGNNFINNYILVFFTMVITISYFINVNRRAQQ